MLKAIFLDVEVSDFLVAFYALEVAKITKVVVIPVRGANLSEFEVRLDPLTEHNDLLISSLRTGVLHSKGWTERFFPPENQS